MCFEYDPGRKGLRPHTQARHQQTNSGRHHEHLAEKLFNETASRWTTSSAGTRSNFSTPALDLACHIALCYRLTPWPIQGMGL